MRDGVIAAGFAELERRVAHDMTALHDLNILCRTRILAIENIFLHSRWSLLSVVLLSLFSPGKVKAMVDEAHEAAMKEYILESARAANALINKPKPNLTVIGADENEVRGGTIGVQR